MVETALAAQLPVPARVVARRQETAAIFTLDLEFTDPAQRAAYRFDAGQFNMLYLFGVGEVPISIVSDPAEPQCLAHTIRAVGRVTRGLAALAEGDPIGIRGPFGRGWPTARLSAEQDVVLVLGGLGCAPVVGMVEYLLSRRLFRNLSIVQGVKHSDDLIWRDRFDRWGAEPQVTVRLAADRAGPSWPGHIGLVTELIGDLPFEPARTLGMMCGPEGMMRAASKVLMQGGVAPANLYLSIERNMQCAVGLCGHCQFGARFCCHDGPVFAYPEVAPWFGRKGY